MVKLIEGGDVEAIAWAVTCRGGGTVVVTEVNTTRQRSVERGGIAKGRGAQWSEKNTESNVRQRSKDSARIVGACGPAGLRGADKGGRNSVSLGGRWGKQFSWLGKGD